jgi:hypothetical protein
MRLAPLLHTQQALTSSVGEVVDLREVLDAAQ